MVTFKNKYVLDLQKILYSFKLQIPKIPFQESQFCPSFLDVPALIALGPS